MTRILTLAILLGLAAAPQALSQCLNCEPNIVTLDGTIYRKDFPGPPNYQSIRGGDERMRYWIFRLTKPVCVEGDNFDNARVTNARDLQLVFADESYYKKYRALVGRGTQFRVVGSLFHQQTGRHVTKILINVTSLVPLRK